MSVMLALLFICGTLEAGYSQTSSSQQKGTYFHRQYTSSEYGAHTQSWSVIEDDRGLIYIGNGNGLLEYDGVEWRMIEVANGQVALSLALGRNNQIYVGSVNDFGVIHPDSLGRPVFRSMTENLPEELSDFEDVWETSSYEGGVMFRTRSAVFHVSYDDSLTIIRPEERFERIHRVGDDIYIVDLATGLMKFENMQFSPVANGEQFKNKSVWYMGSRPDDSIFIATRDGTYLLDEDSVEPFETEITPILTDQNVYHATEIEGKGYAFATIRGGVYVTNYSGYVTDVIDSRILTTNQATYVYSDRLNNLWVTTTNGLNRVEISNPLTYFNETSGLSSGIIDLIKHDGKIYAASPSDIQYLKEREDQTDSPEFITINTSLTGFNVLESTDYGLMASFINGLSEVSENNISPILPEFEAIVVSQSLQNPEHVLLGHRDGIAIFEHSGGEWNLLSTVDGVSEQVYTLEQDSDGIIWAGTDFQGLIRVVPGDSTQVDRFDTETYSNAGSARVFAVDNNIVFSTETGIYRPSDPWNFDEPFSPNISDLMVEHSSLTGTLNIEKGVHGGYWVVTDATIGFTPTLENPLENLQEGALARVSSDAIKAILPDENGILWVANEFGIVRYNSNSDYPGDISFDAFVRGAFQNDEPIFGGMKNGSLTPTQLPYEQNDIRFLFGTNFIEDEDRTRYQVKLAGLDEEWTNWTSEAFKDYTNIPHGRHNLEVRAMNTYGKISTIGTYSFQILPPWWFSWWAYTLYALIFIGGVFAIDRYQRRRLIKKERDRAREIELKQAKEIENAYEDLKAAKDQLVQQEKLASLGQLTAGIAHEIKNPLNFVNNFSDLSLELVDEIREEVLSVKANVKGESSPLEGVKNGGAGQGDDPDSKPKVNPSTSNTPLNPLSRGDFILNILEILDDIEANLKTIHKHGSRADSIVKSMLEHSRGGSGKMEPTNLNGLIKEFVTLTFHGMRAGKDPINVDINFDLDDSLDEVPLIAEDFSRVVINLCNNAFDAMREKVNKHEDFNPELTVKTFSSNGNVTIEIEDNGPGIPDDMRDKIMQPFFTTKKGTQGTGLGLSITNDIIKAHGGKLLIDTNFNQGSTFKVVL